jgi:hypothetical protein
MEGSRHGSSGSQKENRASSLEDLGFSTLLRYRARWENAVREEAICRYEDDQARSRSTNERHEQSCGSGSKVHRSSNDTP